MIYCCTKKVKILLTFLTLFLVFFMTISFSAKKAHAQASGGGGQSAMSVPVSDVLNAPNHFYQQLKESALDGIALSIAKQLLHQMTVSVVNWINSGFKGGPSFVTNPEGFMLDAADQVTGSFLAGNGPLSALCSPWSLDLRITLALQQGQLTNKRYTCTLGKIINNARNARLTYGVNVNTHADHTGIDVNGVNIKDFMGGNFSKNGGWASFIAMTTQDQNNPIGTYIMANKDLQAQIAAKQAANDADRNRGGGFRSYQDCKPVDGGKLYYNQDLNRYVHSTGASTDKECTTVTPGSVIGSSLSKAVGSGTDELVSADEINEVINALVSQLMTQILYKGLANSSTGGRHSVVNQLLDEQTPGTAAYNNLQKSNNKLRGSLSNNLKPYLKSANEIQTAYQQAYTIVASIKTDYDAASACMAGQVQVTNPQSPTLPFGPQAITPLYYASTTELLSVIQTKLDDVNSVLMQLGDMSDAIDTASSTAALSDAGDQLGTLAKDKTLPNSNDVDTANSDLKETIAVSEPWALNAHALKTMYCVFIAGTATSTPTTSTTTATTTP